MDAEQLQGLMDVGLGYAVGGLKAIAILVVGWLVSKWARRGALAAGKRSLNEAAARFIAGIVQYAVIAAAVISALGAVGVQTTSLVAVFASAGLAVGLALQGSLSNFASGVLILFFKPFDLGDLVQVAGLDGAVVDIGVFATTLHTLDNDKIIVPNSAITGGTIINRTVLGTRRGSIAVGVAYGADVGEVIEVLKRAADRVPKILKNPGPGVAFVGLGASSLDFMVRGWCKPDDYIDMLHDLRRAVYEELNAAGIEIPFAQIVVHTAPEDVAAP